MIILTNDLKNTLCDGQWIVTPLRHDVVDYKDCDLSNRHFGQSGDRSKSTAKLRENEPHLPVLLNAEKYDRYRDSFGHYTYNMHFAPHGTFPYI